MINTWRQWIEWEILLTLNMPNTVSLQLTFSTFRLLLGLRSHIKSTPHIFPRWLRWLTHWRGEVKKKLIIRRIFHYTVLFYYLKARTWLELLLVIIGNLLCFCVWVLMSFIIGWYKSLGPEKFVNMAFLASIPVTARWKIVATMRIRFFILHWSCVQEPSSNESRNYPHSKIGKEWSLFSFW